MEEFQIGKLFWVHLVWSAPLALAIAAWGIARRRQTLFVFGHDPARSRLWLAALRRRRWARAGLLALALVFLTAAAVQPRCNPEKTTYKTAARDIAVILDVSRSMLADDLRPSRLERAKLELGRFVDHLKGDRVGLVVFAGEAVIKCPVTANYSYFKSVLKGVSTESARRGGTRIGDAVRKALADLLGKKSKDPEGDSSESAVGQTVMEAEVTTQKPSFAAVLLITDGEDHESYPVQAARSAANHGVKIYAVGLGDKNGTPIPLINKDGTRTFVKDREGRQVLSKLDDKTLFEMVNQSPGAYLDVMTRNFDLVSFFADTIAMESSREVIEEHVFWTEIYQPFLFAGLFFFVISLLVPERPRVGSLTTLELAEAQS